jgi:hypothetical protein
MAKEVTGYGVVGGLLRAAADERVRRDYGVYEGPPDVTSTLEKNGVEAPPLSMALYPKSCLGLDYARR